MMTLHLTSRVDGFPPSRSVSVPSITHRTHLVEGLVVCARMKNRVGNQRFATFLLSLLSPNLQILPQPLDLVIADLGGVNGGGRGGLGFWRGWGGFDGWRRKRNRVPVLFFVCVIFWIYGYCKISGKHLESDKVLEVIGVCLFGLALLKEMKTGVRYLFFGFLSFSASLVFGFKKEDFVKLTSRIRSSSSLRLRKRTSRRRV